MDPILLSRFMLLIAKNIRRAVVRSTLTILATMLLVLVVTLVWSVLNNLSQATEEKESDFKAIITERWQVPSQMPFSYAEGLSQGAAREPDDEVPLDSMTWQFYGGSIEKGKRTREGFVFAFAMEPSKLTTMMDELDSLPEPAASAFNQVVEKMERTRSGIILGREKLKALNKQVGERIKLFGLMYKEIDLELEIVGVFPEGRYDNSAMIHRDYLNAALDQYPLTHAGKAHPMTAKTLNLVWVRAADKTAFANIADQVMSSPSYASPAVKCETASSGIASFLDAYQGLINIMRYRLIPAAVLSLSLIISNAISISVRERRLELAVLKVLGFRPLQILLLVLGEAVLLGAIAGLLSASATYTIVNWYFGGISFPIAFFPKFYIPQDALWWGPLTGGLAALFGAGIPAWNACRVKVTDVFSRVT